VYFRKHTKGMTLVELLVAIALLMLVFGGILTAFQTILKLVGSSKAQAGALSLVNERIEYLRSLPYDQVGTVSGIPNGAIPQNATTSLNGIEYAERVLIEYVDAPEDGTDVLDDNGIVADYKRAKVEYSWVENGGNSKVISLITNIIPPGIETTAGGGTVRVNVFDAQVQPLAGASVRLYNNSGTTTIDVTRNTNASGVALFSGAPARAGYQITVTDTGYSTDKTYSATTSNPIPVTSHVAVLEAEVSTMNFQIDELSQLTVFTKDVATADTFDDEFDDSTQIAATTSVQVQAGSLLLEGAPGSFVPSGSLFSETINPTPLQSWDTLTVESQTPSNTTLRVRVYAVTGTSTRTVLSDAVLPGNSVGFGSGTVVLTGIDASTYSLLSLGAMLTSSSTATSSRLLGWSVGYTEDLQLLTLGLR
jgi:type II secretory pathway pseudopilin PulG